jgi:predicted DNA binding CopG/RHH family protein
MTESKIDMPRFANESEEADWWASPMGRDFAAAKSAESQTTGKQVTGSSLVARLNRKASVQIAIRIPEADLADARRIAEKKGLGYQTLLKMLVHEGLQREMGQEA